MIPVALHAFRDEAAPAGRLAAALGLPLHVVDVHRFPDGETLPTVRGGASTVLVYRSLDRPNAKLMPLLLACDAWRRAGAQRLVLVVPYLCYLRQDAVFSPGQPVSRDVVGELFAGRFDRVVTVDPHLHRTPDLSAVFPGTEVAVLSAAPALAAALGRTGDDLVVGPDVESGPWAAALARALAASHVTLRKTRRGDRDVLLSPPSPDVLRGRRVVIVDDICSSGATLEAALRHMRAAGAASADIAVSHALFGPATERRLLAAGARRIVATDSCAGGAGAAELAPTLAAALQAELRAAPAPC